ncbi:hypothetical protein OCU04_006587 [Sclerotinia nivalis]|uniref:2EXR domain-containing protein n=1 Tax=Sclerotinia nivalis TaxID=352851 RepID=A0A9X0AK86_9HELO|nr:hypothetical protein OCU04_006587 [Sclerotinia nivalis]
MDSSSKILSSEDPKNEDHQNEQTSTPSPDFSLVASHSSRGRNNFPQFTKLPPEIQCMIFERTLPPPHILNFAFRVIRPNDDQEVTGIHSDIAKFPGNLSLLETCQISKDTVYRAFRKIELFPFKTDHPVHLTRLHPGTLSYSYMRPSVDIFMCSAMAITDLYKYGGSIGSISSLTRIATHGMYTWLSEKGQFQKKMTDFFEGLFNTIEENCQALEKFNLVIGGTRSWGGTEIQENGKSTKTWRLLEMDEDFRYLDFVASPRGMITSSFYYPEGPRADVDQILNAANRAMDKLEKHVERKQALKDHAAVEYWRKVKVVPAVLGRMEGRKEKEPRLWLPTLKHTLACHEDGSPLDQYKGLAQIFDGASW